MDSLLINRASPREIKTKIRPGRADFLDTIVHKRPAHKPQPPKASPEALISGPPIDLIRIPGPDPEIWVVISKFYTGDREIRGLLRVTT
ncbi:hypothetical protein VTN31DRAFT_6094 [Thermomyces dupontii]|uniref:uncharacterized protein n=1 Tax=Talaromyces thermophilus TaxID=28565 RepID=UPI0037446D16